MLLNNYDPKMWSPKYTNPGTDLHLYTHSTNLPQERMKSARLAILKPFKNTFLTSPKP